jgi:arylsulfatase A-like enzyme
VPGGAGARVLGGARQVDVLPTVLALLGLPIPHGLAGEPLLDADGAPITKDREAFTHTRMRRDRGHELVGWVHGTTKVIVDRDRRAPMVFDLASDPREQRDVAAARAVAAGYGWQSAASAFAAGPSRPAPVVTLDAETERRLQALGYLERRAE